MQTPTSLDQIVHAYTDQQRSGNFSCDRPSGDKMGGARTSPVQPAFCHQNQTLSDGLFAPNLATTRESMYFRNVSKWIFNQSIFICRNGSKFFENFPFKGHLPLKISNVKGVKQVPVPCLTSLHRCRNITVFPNSVQFFPHGVRASKFLNCLIFIARQCADARCWYSNSVYTSACPPVMFWYSIIIIIITYQTLGYRTRARQATVLSVVWMSCIGLLWVSSADYAVARCSFVRLSVCPSVTRRYSVETAQHIIKLFSPSGWRFGLVVTRWLRST